MKKLLMFGALLAGVLIIKNISSSTSSMEPVKPVNQATSTMPMTKKAIVNDEPEIEIAAGEYRYFGERYYNNQQSLNSFFNVVGDEEETLTIEQLFAANVNNLATNFSNYDNAYFANQQFQGCNLLTGCGGQIDDVSWVHLQNGDIKQDYFHIVKSGAYYLNANLPLPGHPIDLITNQYIMPDGFDFRSSSPLLIDYSNMVLNTDYNTGVLSSYGFKAYIKYFPDYISDGYNFIGIGQAKLMPLPSGSMLWQDGYYQILLYSSAASTIIKYQGIIELTNRLPLINLIAGQGNYYQDDFIMINDYFTATISADKDVIANASAEDITINYFNDFDINLVGNYLGNTKLSLANSSDFDALIEIDNNHIVTAEDKYRLQVTAGSETLDYYFIIDKSAPVGKLLVDDQEVSNNYILTENKSLTFKYDPALAHEANISLTIKENGKEAITIFDFVNEVSFNNPGDYQLILTDAAGNNNKYQFTIDRVHYHQNLIAKNIKDHAFLLTYQNKQVSTGLHAPFVDVRYPSFLTGITCLKNNIPFTCPENNSRVSEKGNYQLVFQEEQFFYSTNFIVGENEVVTFENGNKINEIADKTYFSTSAIESYLTLFSLDQVELYLNDSLLALGKQLLFNRPGEYLIKTAFSEYKLYHQLTPVDAALVLNGDQPIPLTKSVKGAISNASTMLLKLYLSEAVVYLDEQLLARDNKDILLTDEGNYQIFINQRLIFEVTLSHQKPRFIDFIKEKTIALNDKVEIDQYSGVDKDLNLLAASVKIYDETGQETIISNKRPAVYTLDYQLTDRFLNTTTERTYFYVVGIQLLDQNKVIVDQGYARSASFAKNYLEINSFDKQKNLGDAIISINNDQVSLKTADSYFDQIQQYVIAINNKVVFTFTLLSSAPLIELTINNNRVEATYFNDNRLRIKIDVLDVNSIAYAYLYQDDNLVAEGIEAINNFVFEDQMLGCFTIIVKDKVENQVEKSFYYIGAAHPPILPDMEISDLSLISNDYQQLDVASLIPQFSDALGNSYFGQGADVKYFYYNNSNNDFDEDNSLLTPVNGIGEAGSGIYVVRYYLFDNAGNSSYIQQVVTYANVTVLNEYSNGTRVVLPEGYVASGNIIIHVPDAASGISIAVFDGSNYQFIGAGIHTFNFKVGNLIIFAGGFQYRIFMIDDILDIYLTDNTEVNNNYIGIDNLVIESINTFDFTLITDLSSITYKISTTGSEYVFKEGIDLYNFIVNKEQFIANRIYIFNFVINCGDYISIHQSFIYLLASPQITTTNINPNLYLTPDNIRPLVSVKDFILRAEDAVGNLINLEQTTCFVNEILKDCNTLISKDSVITYQIKDNAGNIASYKLNYYFSESYRPSLIYVDPSSNEVLAGEVDHILLKQSYIKQINLAPNAYINKITIKYKADQKGEYVNQEILLLENYFGDIEVQQQALIHDVGNYAFNEGYYLIEVVDSYFNIVSEEFLIIASEEQRPFTPAQTLIISLVVFVVIDLLIFATLYTRKKGIKK